jgi:hypothetical protein
MESLTMHDLTAAYALGALDRPSRVVRGAPRDVRVCREQLAELGGARARSRLPSSRLLRQALRCGSS